jgi:hypothetical protein
MVYVLLSHQLMMFEDQDIHMTRLFMTDPLVIIGTDELL